MRAGLLVVSLALLLAGCGGDDGDDGETHDVGGSRMRVRRGAGAARRAAAHRADGAARLRRRPSALTFETNCGDFTVELDQ